MAFCSFQVADGVQVESKSLKLTNAMKQRCFILQIRFYRRKKNILIWYRVQFVAFKVTEVPSV